MGLSISLAFFNCIKDSCITKFVFTMFFMMFKKYDGIPFFEIQLAFRHNFLQKNLPNVTAGEVSTHPHYYLNNAFKYFTLKKITFTVIHCSGIALRLHSRRTGWLGCVKTYIKYDVDIKCVLVLISQTIQPKFSFY